jgi:hypothetical protein
MRRRRIVGDGEPDEARAKLPGGGTAAVFVASADVDGVPGGDESASLVANGPR